MKIWRTDAIRYASGKRERGDVELLKQRFQWQNRQNMARLLTRPVGWRRIFAATPEETCSTSLPFPRASYSVVGLCHLTKKRIPSEKLYKLGKNQLFPLSVSNLDIADLTRILSRSANAVVVPTVSQAASFCRARYRFWSPLKYV